MALKTKNSPYIIVFSILLYVGFALVNGFTLNFVDKIVISRKGLIIEEPILTLFFYVLSLILNYILPSEWKHRLIYLRCQNSLPGCRVFTKLAKKDNRISYEDLVAQYGELPENPKDQNILWYKIYKKKQADEVVSDSHGRWLLFRDMFAIAFIILVPSAVFTFWYSGIEKGILFTLTYCLLILVLRICARNTGNRFACNVLAR